MLLVSDGSLEFGDLLVVDVVSVELNGQRVSQSVNGMSVLDNQSSEMVDSVDMNVDGSSVNNDFVSESSHLRSVSVNNSGVGNNFLFLIFAIQLSGLWNRSHSQTRDGQETNKGN